MSGGARRLQAARPPLRGVGMTSARTRERLLDRLREQGIRDEAVLERIRHRLAEAGTRLIVVRPNGYTEPLLHQARLNLKAK